MIDKPVNNRAWFFVLPVLGVVLFSSIIPVMTVVNYSVQDTMGANSFFWNGDQWFRDLLNPATTIGARFNDALFRTLGFSLACLLIEVPLGIALALCAPRKRLRRRPSATASIEPRETCRARGPTRSECYQRQPAIGRSCREPSSGSGQRRASIRGESSLRREPGCFRKLWGRRVSRPIFGSGSPRPTHRPRAARFDRTRPLCRPPSAPRICAAPPRHPARHSSGKRRAMAPALISRFLTTACSPGRAPQSVRQLTGFTRPERHPSLGPSRRLQIVVLFSHRDNTTLPENAFEIIVAKYASCANPRRNRGGSPNIGVTVQAPIELPPKLPPHKCGCP